MLDCPGLEDLQETFGSTKAFYYDLLRGDIQHLNKTSLHTWNIQGMRRK